MSLQPSSMSALDLLYRQHVDGFHALTIVVANGYFIVPSVCMAVHYPGQEARDNSLGLGDEEVELLRTLYGAAFPRRWVR